MSHPDPFTRMLRYGVSMDYQPGETVPIVDGPLPVVVFPDGRKKRAAILLHLPDPYISGDVVLMKAVTLADRDAPADLDTQVRIGRTMEQWLLDGVKERRIVARGALGIMVMSGDWRTQVAGSLVPRIEAALVEHPDQQAVLAGLVDVARLPLPEYAVRELRRLRRVHIGASVHLTSFRGQL